MLVPQPPTAGELPRPRPTTVIDNETVSAMLEMTGADQALLGRAEGDAADLRRRERQPARQRRSAAGAARQRARVCGARCASACCRRANTSPRAIITPPGQPEMRLTRPFMLSPTAWPPRSRRPISACRSIPTRRRRRWRRRRSSRRCRASRRAPSSTPEVVQPFLDGLVDMHPPSPEVEAVIEKAASGNYEAPGSRGDVAGRRTESRVRARPRRAQQRRDRAGGGVVPADAEGRVGFSRRRVLSRRHARGERPRRGSDRRVADGAAQRESRRGLSARWSMRCCASATAGRRSTVLEEAPAAWARRQRAPAARSDRAGDARRFQRRAAEAEGSTRQHEERRSAAAVRGASRCCTRCTSRTRA